MMGCGEQQISSQDNTNLTRRENFNTLANQINNQANNQDDCEGEGEFEASEGAILICDADPNLPPDLSDALIFEGFLEDVLYLIDVELPASALNETDQKTIQLNLYNAGGSEVVLKDEFTFFSLLPEGSQVSGDVKVPADFIGDIDRTKAYDVEIIIDMDGNGSASSGDWVGKISDTKPRAKSELSFDDITVVKLQKQ